MRVRLSARTRARLRVTATEQDFLKLGISFVTRERDGQRELVDFEIRDCRSIEGE